MKICRLVLLVSVLAFASSYAAGLVVPQGGIALGEVRPGEAIEKTAEVKMVAGGTVGELISSRKSEKLHDCADETEAVIL